MNHRDTAVTWGRLSSWTQFQPPMLLEAKTWTVLRWQMNLRGRLVGLVAPWQGAAGGLTIICRRQWFLNLIKKSPEILKEHLPIYKPSCFLITSPLTIKPVWRPEVCFCWLHPLWWQNPATRPIHFNKVWPKHSCPYPTISVHLVNSNCLSKNGKCRIKILNLYLW